MKIGRLLLACICLSFFVMGPLAASNESQSASIEVTPLEDLMCEHGVLNRVMLIYEEMIRRIDQNEKFRPALLQRAAEVIRDLIENHHEKLEEKYIFTTLEDAGILVEEVKILREQHTKGRILTKYIIENAVREKLRNPNVLQAMKKTLLAFIEMYRPHEAREDSLIFPTFRSLLTEQEYLALGELFEEEEHRHFGKDPLESFVEKIAEIERKLGIYNLAQFTPM